MSPDGLYILLTRKSAQYSLTYILDPREDLGPMGPLRSPSQCACKTKGLSYAFRIMKIRQVVSKVCPRQIASHWAFYLGPQPKRPQGPIFYTLLKVVSMTLNKFKKFPVNPVEAYFAK